MNAEVNSAELDSCDIPSYATSPLVSAKFSRIQLRNGQFWRLLVSCGHRSPTDEEVGLWLRTFFGDDTPCEEPTEDPATRQFFVPMKAG